MSISPNATHGDNGRIYQPRKFTPLTKTRFARDRRRRLVAHLGGSISPVQAILVNRLIDLEWESARISSKRDRGEELSAHGARAFMAMQNHIRLLGRELGLKSPAPKAPTLAEYLAAKKPAAAA
jgi:hypothetical protein